MGAQYSVLFLQVPIEDSIEEVTHMGSVQHTARNRASQPPPCHMSVRYLTFSRASSVSKASRPAAHILFHWSHDRWRVLHEAHPSVLAAALRSHHPRGGAHVFSATGLKNARIPVVSKSHVRAALYTNSLKLRVDGQRPLRAEIVHRAEERRRLCIDVWYGTARITEAYMRP